MRYALRVEVDRLGRHMDAFSGHGLRNGSVSSVTVAVNTVDREAYHRVCSATAYLKV